MKKEFSILNNKKKWLSIDGITLLRTMHEAVKDILTQYASRLEVPKNGIFEIHSAKSWLDSIGHLCKFKTGHDKQGECWLPIDIEVGKSVVSISEDSTVSFPNNQGSYEDITKTIRQMLKKYKYSASKLARILLKKLSGKDYPDEIEENHKVFLNSLLVLMFGVEPSRNNTTLLTSLLLLDLIRAKQRYGSRNEIFDWRCAFVSRHGYHWDDWEHKPYGGKYPMAQSSTGKGNLGAGVQGKKGVLLYGRRDFIEKNSSEEILSQLLDEYPQRHAVPRREISLVIHWLDSLSKENQDLLKEAQNEDALLDQIKRLVVKRLKCGYLRDEQPNFLKTPAPKKMVPLKMQSKKIEKSRAVLEHSKDDGTASRSYSFHRIDVACKLIPGWVANGETKKLPKTEKLPETIIQGKLSGFYSIKDSNKKDKCTYCYSRPYPLQSTELPPKNTAIVITRNHKKTHRIHRYKNEDCGISSKITKRTIHPEKINEKCGLVMFFGQAKKMKLAECKECLPSTPIEELSGKISKLGSK